MKNTAWWAALAATAVLFIAGLAHGHGVHYQLKNCVGMRPLGMGVYIYFIDVDGDCIADRADKVIYANHGEGTPMVAHFLRSFTRSEYMCEYNKDFPKGIRCI